MAVTVYINGKKEELKEAMTVAKLLEIKNIRAEVVTVELNEQIIERAKYRQALLKSNDRLEFVYYMGGGGSTPLRFAQGRSPLSNIIDSNTFDYTQHSDSNTFDYTQCSS